MTRSRLRSGLERGQALGFLVLLHVLPLPALVSGPRAADWLTGLALYALSCVGVGVGLHRYFAHRSFRTSRAFQFLLGLLAASAFGNPVGFAGKHRLHHRHSDTGADVHSPGQGFWFCWYGSLVDDGYTEAERLAMVPDWTRYPELGWLHRWFFVPGLTLGALTWIVGGFSAFAIGFCLSRVVILNLTSTVNFFCHRSGRQPYATGDRSTNNALVALITLGEGWHNNHHHFPAAARAGFHWWQVDPLYWVIRLLAALGLVWDVQEVPDRVRDGRVGPVCAA